MRKTIFLFFSVALLFACKHEAHTHKDGEKHQHGEKHGKHVKAKMNYPKYVKDMLKAHGGMDKWNKLGAMSYEIVKEEGNEKQYINLGDRRERIESSNFTMGYDGKDFWMEADTSVKTNPKFYKNLMFYFYAMPFVIGDPGIKYEKVEPLVFEGKSYPGFRVSYNSGIGVSPEDEYIIHFNEETKQMEWLAYTVTFFTQEKSSKLSWIRYDDWQDIGGVKLPSSMAWQKTEDNKPVGEANRRVFANVKVQQEAFADSKFQATAGAKVFE